MRLLDELNYLDVNITSIDLKFSNKGYNFMSITLSSADAVAAILNVHPPMLNGKKVYIKPALFQPRRNLNRPVGNKKHDSKVSNATGKNTGIRSSPDSNSWPTGKTYFSDTTQMWIWIRMRKPSTQSLMKTFQNLSIVVTNGKLKKNFIAITLNSSNVSGSIYILISANKYKKIFRGWILRKVQ